MKKTTLISAIIFCGCLNLLAQDAYHTTLVSQMQTLYNVPAGNWVLPNTEAATFAASTTYGTTATTLAITGQDFTEGRKLTVSQGANPWSSGHTCRNSTAIAANDVCLVVMWLRSPTAGAKVNVFAEHVTTYAKQFYSTVRLGSEWSQVLVPFKASNAFVVNQLSIGMHTGLLAQSVEVGGVAVINYTNTVTVAQLPLALNNDFYPGSEPDAPWRTDAEASIEQIRKANLQVLVTNSAGQPLPNAVVKIEMQQHEFGFGSAIVSNKFNGGSAQNSTYEQKIHNLDGNGHGFNEIVFENDHKWDAWEEHWFSSQAEIGSDIDWLQQKNIKVRGHNLVWPKWDALPDDMYANRTNRPYMKNRIRQHLFDVLQNTGSGGNNCIDWDVLNEITELNDLATAFAGYPGYPTGREIYPEIFRMADSLIPDVKLYINDYIAIEQGDLGNGNIALWKSKINEIVATGAPLEGIGFQGHFSSLPTGIPRVKEIYDEFYNAYGLEAKVTEYDIDKNVPPATQASYMRDILTITFAHPSMKAFLMWGFWDGAHWLGNAPIFNENWTLKPSGEAFIDQVFKQWWTDSTLVADAGGVAALRGFRGDYKVSVTCNGTTQVQFLKLDGNETVNFQMACTVATDDLSNTRFSAQLATNLVRNELQVVWKNADTSQEIAWAVRDTKGVLVAEKQEMQPLMDGNAKIDCSKFAPGAYVVTWIHGGQLFSQKFIKVAE